MKNTTLFSHAITTEKKNNKTKQKKRKTETNENTHKKLSSERKPI